MKKNVESFKDVYHNMNYRLSILCFSETWVEDVSFDKNLLFHSENYD